MVPARGEELTHSVPGILLFVSLTQYHKEKRAMLLYSDKVLGSVLPALIKKKIYMEIQKEMLLSHI
jgi:hypothetical protein